jgi:hypothetical protein
MGVLSHSVEVGLAKSLIDPLIAGSIRPARSRLRGAEGAAIWENWAVLAYDVDTAAALPTRRPRRTGAPG